MLRAIASRRSVALSGMPPELAAAYEKCRLIHATHGRTYYLATRLLPADRRSDVWALYAFARVADDLVDATANPDPAIVLAWRDRAMGVMQSTSGPDPTAEPVLAATWHTMSAFGLEPNLLEEFLDSMVMDLTISRYETWDDLRGYMRGSAAVIGELMAPLLGASGYEALHHAATLGEAFQLTNFIRDISEDHARGRIYLPQVDLARFGVSEALLADAVRTGAPAARVRSLVAFEVRRAVSLYAAAKPGLGMVDARSQPCLRMAFTLYRRILHRVIANDFNVFERRLAVPTWQRLATVGHVATRTAGANVIQPVASRAIQSVASRVIGPVASSRRSTPRPRS